jgi:hypothetical protein
MLRNLSEIGWLLPVGVFHLLTADNDLTQRAFQFRTRVTLSRMGSWRGSRRLRFQLPPVKPCMWFSHTRLSDIVHRQACAVR